MIIILYKLIYLLINLTSIPKTTFKQIINIFIPIMIKIKNKINSQTKTHKVSYKKINCFSQTKTVKKILIFMKIFMILSKILIINQ